MNTVQLFKRQTTLRFRLEQVYVGFIRYDSWLKIIVTYNLFRRLYIYSD